MKTRWIFITFLILSCCSKPPKAAPPKYLVTVTTPTVRDVDLYNEYVGHVEALVQIEVKSQVEGLLTNVLFTEGQFVEAGDLIFTIDCRPYEAQLDKAEAGLARSIASLQLAEDVVKRYAKLVQEEFVSQLDFDQYITNVLVDKADILQNKADIETAKINISYCNITSPINAITGKLKIDKGNLIQNASEMPLVVLNQITPIYVYFNIPQSDFPQIQKLYSEKSLQVQAILNQDVQHPFIGKLNLIDNQVDEQTGTLLLRGIFENEDKILWPGEFVTARLVLETKKSAILVPTESIQLGQDGYFIFVIKEDETAELKKVEIGQRIGNQTIVESGLTAHEQVVTSGQINLTTGAKVEIKKS